jgi:hypothetical protein
MSLESESHENERERETINGAYPVNCDQTRGIVVFESVFGV